MNRTPYLAVLIFSPIIVLVASYMWAPPASAKDPLVVFLVRHAEKAEAASDPELTAEGKQRASLLAKMMRDSKVKHVHSSDYKRTRDTAAPVARLLKAKVDLYDPRVLPTLVEKLQQLGGRHLVVGHSNTTPMVVQLLGGEPGTAINEPKEYDRLYIITVDQEAGTASTVLMRYGRPFQDVPNP